MTHWEQPYSASKCLLQARTRVAELEDRIQAESRELGSPLSIEFLNSVDFHQWSDYQHFWTPLQIGRNSSCDFRVAFKQLRAFCQHHRLQADPDGKQRASQHPDEFCNTLLQQTDQLQKRAALNTLLEHVLNLLLPYFQHLYGNIFREWRMSPQYNVILLRYVKNATWNKYNRLFIDYRQAREEANGIALMLTTQKFNIPHISADSHDIYVYHRQPSDDLITRHMRENAFHEHGQSPAIDLQILECLESIFPPELVAIIFNFARSGPENMRLLTLKCNREHSRLQECLR